MCKMTMYITTNVLYIVIYNSQSTFIYNSMTWKGSGPKLKKEEMNLISEPLKYKLFLPHYIIPSTHGF